jgi:hypothetical protein
VSVLIPLSLAKIAMLDWPLPTVTGLAASAVIVKLSIIVSAVRADAVTATGARGSDVQLSKLPYRFTPPRKVMLST